MTNTVASQILTQLVKKLFKLSLVNETTIYINWRNHTSGWSTRCNKHVNAGIGSQPNVK